MTYLVTVKLRSSNATQVRRVSVTTIEPTSVIRHQIEQFYETHMPGWTMSINAIEPLDDHVTF